MSQTVSAESGPNATAQCWCCGATDAPDRLVHLGNHPEVGVCPRCARSLAKWAGEVEDNHRSGPAVAARQQFRRVRRGVVRRGWHHSRFVGRALRRLGRHLP